MSLDIIPVVSALMGALIGAMASVATILISSHFENRRYLSRLAYEAALADYKLAHELGGKIAPLTSFIHFHIECMKLINDGKLNQDELKKLKKIRDEIFPVPTK